MKRPRKYGRVIDYNEANPVRKQDPVSPAHAFLRQAIWPRNYQLVMFLYRNPGATKEGICDLMKWPLWKVRNQFTKMFQCGLMTRQNVGSRLYRYYLTREAFLVARMAVEIDEVLSNAGSIADSEE